MKVKDKEWQKHCPVCERPWNSHVEDCPEHDENSYEFTIDALLECINSDRIKVVNPTQLLGMKKHGKNKLS